MAEEIEVIVDDTQEEVSLFVGNETGVTKHSELDLDDGTNPHGTTISDVDPNAANIAYTNEDDQIFTSNKNIFLNDLVIGNETVVNKLISVHTPSSTKIYTTDGGVTDLPVIPSNIAYTDEENIFTEDQTIEGTLTAEGVKSSENDPTKVFATDGSVVDVGETNTIDSITSGEPTGSDQVVNVVSLTQAEYDAGTPIVTTFYIITD